MEVAGLDEVLDAIVGNGQNHAAAGTSQSLLSLLRNAGRGRLPSADARNRFFQMLLRTRRRDAFAETVALFETDGGIAPPRAPDEDD